MSRMKKFSKPKTLFQTQPAVRGKSLGRLLLISFLVDLEILDNFPDLELLEDLQVTLLDDGLQQQLSGPLQRVQISVIITDQLDEATLLKVHVLLQYCSGNLETNLGPEF